MSWKSCNFANSKLNNAYFDYSVECSITMIYLYNRLKYEMWRYKE